MEVCHFFHVSVSFNLTELLYSTHILMPCVCAVFEHMVGNDASANLCQRKLYSGFASFFFPSHVEVKLVNHRHPDAPDNL